MTSNKTFLLVITGLLVTSAQVSAAPLPRVIESDPPVYEFEPPMLKPEPIVPVLPTPEPTPAPGVVTAPPVTKPPVTTPPVTDLPSSHYALQGGGGSVGGRNIDLTKATIAFPGTSAEPIRPYGECVFIDNSSTKEYFVPLATKREWDAFKANAPFGVTIRPCSGSGICGLADMQAFENSTKIPSADLCQVGTADKAPSGNGPWSWNCVTDPSSPPAACSALQEASCEKPGTGGAIVFVQDLTGSFWDDLPNLQTAMYQFIASPSYEEWQVGVTSFLDFGDAYVYRQELGLVTLRDAQAAVRAAFNGMKANGGDDLPEAQLYALQMAAAGFNGKTDRPITIVLVTDAPYHVGGNYGNEAQAAAALNSRNMRLIVLASEFGATGPGNQSNRFIYEQFIARNGIKGTVVNLSSNSSNFQSALLEGFDNVCGNKAVVTPPITYAPIPLPPPVIVPPIDVLDDQTGYGGKFGNVVFN